MSSQITVRYDALFSVSCFSENYGYMLYTNKKNQF